MEPYLQENPNFSLQAVISPKAGSTDADGLYVVCGHLHIGRRKYYLEISWERYAATERHYWIGVRARSKDAIVDLDAALRDSGYKVASRFTERSGHFVEGPPRHAQLKVFLPETAWGKVILETYADGFFLGKYVKANTTSEQLSEMATIFWRQLGQATFFEEIVLEGQIAQQSRAARIRSELLRREAVKRYSKNGRLVCSACPFSAPAKGSELSIIEFHHLQQVASYGVKGKKRAISAAVDNLRPLCPTCHRVAHRGARGKPLSIARVRATALNGIQSAINRSR
jgi:hypothetical protein